MARKLLVEDEVFPVRESELELTIPIDAEAVYYLRPLTLDTARRVSNAHTRLVPNRRTHQRDEVTDKVAINNELLDYTIVKWEGVSNHSEKAPCDLAHKLLLPVEVQAALIERAQTGEADTAKSFRDPA